MTLHEIFFDTGSVSNEEKKKTVSRKGAKAQRKNAKVLNAS
jgi:hypothetical protein